MKHEFICSQCKEHKVHESDITTGYGTDNDGNKVCFECCGKNDLETLGNLPKGERMCLYLNTKDKTVSNWPGTLKINVGYIRTGKHNIAGKRYDTWFSLGQFNYHAVSYGDFTEICHVKKLKHSH